MKYKCLLCGYVYDEEKEGKPFSELTNCPVCMAPASMLQPVEEEEAPEVSKEISQEAAQDAGNDRTAQAAAGADHQTEPSRKDLDYPEIYVRKDKDIRYMEEIHQMAVTGKTVSAAMATGFKMPSWDDILIMGAQLDPMPLAEDEPVSTRTVIGKNAKTVDIGKSCIRFPYVLWRPFQRSQDRSGQGNGHGGKCHVLRRRRHTAGRNGSRRQIHL